MWKNVFQVEPREVVGKTVLHRPGLLPGLWVVPFVLGDEPRVDKDFKGFRERSAANDVNRLGHFNAGAGAVYQGKQDLLLKRRLLAEHLAEYGLEVSKQNTVMPEAHPLDVLVGA